MPILAFFSGPFGRWAIIGLLVAGAGVTGWIKGNAHGTAKLAEYQAKQATEAVRIVQARGKVTERVVNHYITKIVPQTELVTRTIEREITKYELAKLDSCPISVAAVGLHNAAAANVVPDPAGTTDGTASGLEAAALTKTCAENYAVYHQTANRLTALQDWVRGQAGVR
jgi:hypothetical protein